MKKELPYDPEKEWNGFLKKLVDIRMAIKGEDEDDFYAIWFLMIIIIVFF